MSKKPERLGQSVMVPDGYVTRQDVDLLRGAATEWPEGGESAAALNSLADRIEAMLPSVAR